MYFSTLSPPKLDPFGRRHHLQLEHHTLWLQSKESKIHQTLPFSRTWIQKLAIFASVSFWLPLYCDRTRDRRRRRKLRLPPTPPLPFGIYTKQTTEGATAGKGEKRG